MISDAVVLGITLWKTLYIFRMSEDAGVGPSVTTIFTRNGDPPSATSRAIPLIIYRSRQYSIRVRSFSPKITIPYEHQSSALFAVNTLTMVLDVLSVATDKVNV